MKAHLLVLLAVVALLPISARAQTATPATQVPAGSSAAIGQAKGTKSNLPDTPEAQKIFKNAQSPEVRKTLQEAIDATPDPK